MSEPAKKSSAKIIVLAVVVLAAAGAFFGVSYWEKNQAKAIEDEIKAASGSVTSVKVGFWDKSTVITGLKIKHTYFNAVTIDADVESLTLSGMNIGALTAKGVVPLVDTVAMTNAKVILVYLAQPGTPMAPQKQETLLKSCVVTGLRGDFAAWVEALDNKALLRLEEDPQVALSLIAIAKGFHADSITTTSYETRQDMGLPTPVVSAVDSFQAKDFGLLSCGAASWKNMRVTAMGQELVKIGEMGMGKMVIPDFFSLAVASIPPGARGLDSVGPTFGPALLKKLEQEPVVMQGFTMSDASFQAMSAEAITLKNLSLDLEFGSEKLVLKKSFDDLVIPPAYYRNGQEVGALLAQAYGKPLSFSGRVDALGAQKNGKIDLQVKDAGLVEKEFGSVKLDMDLLAAAAGVDTLEKLLEASPDWLLKKAQITLEDKKALDLTFTAQYEMLKAFDSEQMPIKSAADMRAMAAKQLQQEAAASPNPDAKAIKDGLAKLVQNPGTLVINLNPDTPQSLSVLEALDEGAGPSPTPGAYKATVQYTQAK